MGFYPEKDKVRQVTVDGDIGKIRLNGTQQGIESPAQNSDSTSQNSGSTSQNSGSNGGFNYKEFKYEPYKDSDIVKNAKNALDLQLKTKPDPYKSKWQTQLDDVIGKIMNREKFSYDINGDALYQQYKNKYIQQGKMAMQDTMGQAAAMTGGYGNSYAASVGNQAYQASLQQLNDVVPELWQLAYDRYNQEGQELYNQYGLISDRDNTDYEQYIDSLSDYYNERDYLANRYVYEKNFNYGKYSDEKAYEYQNHKDEISHEQWLAEQALADRQVTLQERQYNETMNYNKEQASNELNKAIYARDDDYGNSVFYINGKEQTFKKGVNPYTGTTNNDVKNGTFSNGYQPNNINGEPLSKTGITDVVNGVTQNVWKTPDGTKWIWDGSQNKYLKYED